MSGDVICFHLKNAMKKDCCPVCALIGERIGQMMDSFLYESVNDGTLREKIRASRGFCPFHAAALMKKGDPLGHAVIYRGLLQLAVQDAEKGNFEKYTDRDSCLFCGQEREMEKVYLKGFAAGFDDEAFREKYRSEGMLCMPHLAALAEITDKKRYREMEAATADKYMKLTAQLDEIIVKNDYRHLGEEWDDSLRTAWKRAVNVISGGRETGGTF